MNKRSLHLATALASLILTTLCTATSFDAQAKAVAQANFDLATGKVCFPMLQATTGFTYDVCLKLEPLNPGTEFSLLSVAPAAYDLADIPTYSQQTGLKLPYVKLSDGRIFTDVSMGVTLDTVSSKFSFVVKDARKFPFEIAHSVARLWNEALLGSIRKDLARPTIHARNLFHIAVAMYDAWAAFDTTATPYLLGKTLNGYNCSFAGIPVPANLNAAREEAISYAAFRILRRRFANSPGAEEARRIHEGLMIALGLDKANTSRDYSQGSAAALGNHIADCVIAYGLQDGSNETNSYASQFYTPLNPSFMVAQPGNPTVLNPDRWQPLAFELFRDQSGNLFNGSVPPFVTPEWGNVLPFALKNTAMKVLQRDGRQWRVYHDPGPQARLSEDAEAADYRWNHELVAMWSGQLDPSDGVMWDISPLRIGNVGTIDAYPKTPRDLQNFYNLEAGGDISPGRQLNPVTGMPYQEQLVPRGDYTRVLAEFWADGPNSETPPGHWFTIFNYVSDNPLLQKRMRGAGPVLDDLEWNIKGYLALGGAMHDAAVTAWSIKGYYDTSRPVTAIRYMGERGQSSVTSASNFDRRGVDLIPGHIETVAVGDPLAGSNGEHIGKIKLYAWRGPGLITDPAVEKAGAGWILAENWWPYQRPTFVSPPFAGYISGHSTFSRAAAEVMTLLTGDEYFPGGMSNFVAKKNEFLVFEEGPSVDVVLQWATYRDASDQCSLSRIWGGIHPPMDDMPGRLAGAIIGVDAFNKAASYFDGTAR